MFKVSRAALQPGCSCSCRCSLYPNLATSFAAAQCSGAAAAAAACTARVTSTCFAATTLAAAQWKRHGLWGSFSLKRLQFEQTRLQAISHRYHLLSSGMLLRRQPIGTTKLSRRRAIAHPYTGTRDRQQLPGSLRPQPAPARTHPFVSY